MCNTMHYDQYSRLAICLNIFQFSVINSKTILKFGKSFSLVSRTCRDESIDIITHCTLINIHASLFV